MLYFSASVLNTPFSTSRSSRRITLSWVVVLPDERDAVDEVLLALLHPHRDVDDRRALALGRADAGRQRRGRLRLGRVRIVAELEVGKAGELEVAAAAVHFARLLEALADLLRRCSTSPGFILNSGRSWSFLTTVLPANVDGADLVAAGPRSTGMRSSIQRVFLSSSPRARRACGAPTLARDVAVVAGSTAMMRSASSSNLAPPGTCRGRS